MSSKSYKVKILKVSSILLLIMVSVTGCELAGLKQASPLKPAYGFPEKYGYIYGKFSITGKSPTAL